MKNHILFLLCFSPVFSPLAFAAEAIQTYRIGWYPTDEATCQRDAEVIAQRFEVTTGMPVLTVGCERAFSWKLDIVIQYQAGAPLVPTSTFDESADRQGMYATKAECESNLQSEKAVFQEKTGLSPIVAFCFAQGTPGRENPRAFVLRMDGFGNPKLRPFVLAKIFYDIFEGSPADIARTVREALSANEHLSDLQVINDNSSGLSRVVVKYYAVRRQPIMLASPVSFETIQACNENRVFITNLFNEFGISGARAFCALEDYSDSSPLYLAGSVVGAYSLERVPRTFANRQQCQDALPELVSRYAASSEANLVKGFCSYERPNALSNYGFFAKVLVQN